MTVITTPIEATTQSFTVGGTPTTGPWAFSFHWFQKTDLVVTVGGVSVGQSGFSVSGGVAQEGGTIGGDITLAGAVSSTTVRVYRLVLAERIDNFSPAATAPLRDVDVSLNRLVAMIQDTQTNFSVGGGSGGSSLAPIADATILGNVSGATTTPVAISLSAIIDKTGLTRGSILYRGALFWSALGPGTNGDVLRTNGVGADPTWTATTNITTVLDADLDMLLFGDGRDGDVTVSGVVTLTQDMYYNNLTLSAGAALNPAGWRIFVKGVLDLTAAPAGAIGVSGGNGSAGSFASGGAGASTSQPAATIGGNSVSAGNGGGGTAGAGGTQAPTVTVTRHIGGPSGAGGAGGAGSSGAGGASRGATSSSPWCDIRRLTTEFAPWVTTAANLNQGGIPAPGGSGASGDGTNSGGGGGGGGQGGGCIALYARTINRGGSTAVGAIRVLGGAGGAGVPYIAGNTGGGGGAAGGGGGWLYLVCRSLTGSAATNALDATGGSGGAGGNGLGTGLGGNGGGAGGGGRIDVYNLGAGTRSITANGTAVAGAAASGITGGVATNPTAQRVNL